MALYYIIQGATNLIVYRIVAASAEEAYNCFLKGNPRAEIGAYVVAQSVETKVKM